MSQKSKIQLRILGCGSSGGVPRINGDWGDCDPTEVKNRRSRCSVLIRKWSDKHSKPTQVLIDTSPDMREQLLAANVKRLDAVVYTHDHADQSHGIDDLRAIAYSNKMRLPVHMDTATASTLMTRFGYCFHGGGGYPSILEGKDSIRVGEVLNLDGPGGKLELLPLDQDHGRIRSLGFRMGPIAYCNDTVGLPEDTFQALDGVDTLIVDALRYHQHPSHAHLDLALEWIDRVKPRIAVLTNMHIDMDYKTLQKELPENVMPAYDGMELEASY
ncbi:MBL fold metallo-hydrolase [Hirschia baltica]|uniref:Beta-lactamase-like protein n=1 Tax=Hirschia baltica (strain ATCC 49814 / DSM 5838 / IFAM 1418) TaxID=582402 RepID=C6XJM1_HIRBI|nr:MBL fold metallo-hydrolase [Hirschia baltica]ACT59316.1 beta-lactamase-like protein [Hirschia baltica ATCC 49814]